jgi:predicted nucleotidyltransferase
MPEINGIAERIRALAEKYGIVYAILYGSIIDGRFMKKESDIDLAIKLSRLGGEEARNLLKALLKDLGAENLDLVILNVSPFSLNFKALTRGRVIFCKDWEELYEDRLMVRKLYDDWIHISKVFQERELKKVKG